MSIKNQSTPPFSEPECCARGACKASLQYGTYYKIWNQFSSSQPRLYCEPCGHKIMYYNKADALNGGLVLRYEIVERPREGLLHHVNNSAPFINNNRTTNP